MTSAADSSASSMLGELLSRIPDLSSTAPNKFDVTEQCLATQLHIGSGAVKATWVSAPKMLAPRLSTPGVTEFEIISTT